MTKPKDCDHHAWTAVVTARGDRWYNRTCDECGIVSHRQTLKAGQSITILLHPDTLSAEEVS